MKTSRTDEIIREVAVKHGVSCEEVTSTLAAAIDYLLIGVIVIVGICVVILYYS